MTKGEDLGGFAELCKIYQEIVLVVPDIIILGGGGGGIHVDQETFVC